MKKFSWFNATSIEEAHKEVTATVSQLIQPNGPDQAAVLKAGGVDLLDLMKEGLAQPKKVVNISRVPGLDQITYSSKEGLTIGANARLSEIGANTEIKTNYLALHQAVMAVATPQIRNMATLGGNLAQRTRCWYFRSLDHQCFRKGSGTCFARDGENEFHAVMKNGGCVSVHASSVSTALLAFDASVEISIKNGQKKSVKLTEFFVAPGDDSRRETILDNEDIITAIKVPPTGSKVKSHYIKYGVRESHDWSIADVAVVAEVSGSKCKWAKVSLGAAAPIPIVSKEAGQVLAGSNISEEIAWKAGEEAMKSATPLSNNAYKVPIFRALIKRNIMKLV